MTYEPKSNAVKHKHHYSVECILEVTNKNIHATGNYYNRKEYYTVLKCNICDSFIPDSRKGNSSGHILNDEYNKKLPLITAKTNMKCPEYNFNNLYDIDITSNTLEQK